MQSTGICLAVPGHCYGQSPDKSPAQIPGGKCEITPASLGMKSKVPQIHGTAGMALSSNHGTKAPLTNDWCINAVKTDTKLRLDHTGNLFIIKLTEIKFEIWRVICLKKSFGL